jgi:hypothetical protein
MTDDERAIRELHRRAGPALSVLRREPDAGVIFRDANMVAPTP